MQSECGETEAETEGVCPVARSGGAEAGMGNGQRYGARRGRGVVRETVVRPLEGRSWEQAREETDAE